MKVFLISNSKKNLLCKFPKSKLFRIIFTEYKNHKKDSPSKKNIP